MFGKRDRKTDVLIVGGGPAGLFTALCLTQLGVGVQIIDKAWRPAVRSYALALHPRSLALLDELGLTGDLIEQGHRVERVALYHDDARVAVLDYSSLDAAFPFLLVLPQSALERRLERELEKRKVAVRRNHQAMGLTQANDAVTVKVARMEKYSLGYPVAHTEWMVAKSFDVRASWVVGADGYHSSVREFLGLKYESLGPSEMFAVFEFPGTMDFVHEARVVFSAGTTNVIWPLSEGRGRWSFQVTEPPADGSREENFRRILHSRVPWFRPGVEEVSWSTTALFERRLVERFGQARTWLLGDAAHITGPVGVQSMNVGLLEARDLAEQIAAAHGGQGSNENLESYGERWRADWLRLLGAEGGLRTQADAPEGVRQNAQRILPCVPASGKDLERLLAQVGLVWS